MKAWAENSFFRMMGLSGWLYVCLLVTSSMSFNPAQFGGHLLLYLTWLLAAAIWLCSRWGTWLKGKFHG